MMAQKHECCWCYHLQTRALMMVFVGTGEEKVPHRSVCVPAQCRISKYKIRVTRDVLSPEADWCWFNITSTEPNISWKHAPARAALGSLMASHGCTTIVHLTDRCVNQQVPAQARILIWIHLPLDPLKAQSRQSVQQSDPAPPVTRWWVKSPNLRPNLG